MLVPATLSFEHFCDHQATGTITNYLHFQHTVKYDLCIYAIYVMGFFVRWIHLVGSSDSLFVKFPVEITTYEISFATWNVL